jgi:predicted O-methyltransferase YrrM
MPFQRDKQPGLRYYSDNPFFMYADALLLYSMLRHYRPHRVIEVGSGFSSAVMLDTNDTFLSRSVRFTFIEPYPDRLLSLIGERDRKKCDVLPVMAQDVPLTVFESLEPGDVLFVDSSHIAKIGSDVVYLLTDVLPRLRSGVLIHFHDIFWPFEYPEEWVREGRAWNENYMLKAFLQYNSSFKIVLFSPYLALHHRATLDRLFPLWMTSPGASLWLAKVS